MLSNDIFRDHNINNAALHVLPNHKKGFIDHEPFININGLQNI